MRKFKFNIGDKVQRKGLDWNRQMENGIVIGLRECKNDCTIQIDWKKGPLKFTTSWSNFKYLELDKQYYREERLKQILG